MASPHIMDTYARLPVAFTRGEGVWLWDRDGKRYLDAVAGVAVNAIGHCHPKLVAAALDAVMSGGTFFSPSIHHTMAELARSGPRQGLQGLTEREREVLVLIARGLSTKDIANTLSIGARTVETHRANLMRKLGVKSVALLTQVAIREGILPIPPST